MTSLALSLVSPENATERIYTRFMDTFSRKSFEPFSDSDSELDISVNSGEASDELEDEILNVYEEQDPSVTSEED